MVLIDCDVSIEQFDYSPADGDWAVVRLLATLGQSPTGPSGSYLVVESGPDGDELVYAPMREGLLERRLLSGKSRGSQLLWNASFDMPLEVVQAPQAVFKLLAGREAGLALPAPWLRDVTPRALALTSIEERRRRSLPKLALHRPRRLAALSTALAITGTSAPALALAAGVAGSGTAAGVSHAAGGGSSAFALNAGQTAVTTYSSTSTSTSPTTAAQTPTPQTSTTETTTTQTTSVPTTTTTTSTAPASTTTTTTTTTVATTTPTTTTKKPPCRSQTRADVLVTNASSRAKHVKPGVGMSTAPLERNCTQTKAPKRGHTHVTKPHPKQNAHPRKGTHHPGSQHPTSPAKRRPGRVTGGAPLTAPPAARQPDHTLSPTPSSSSSGSGGAAEAPVPTLSSAPSFVNPGSWTGTVTADPSLTGAVRNLAGLLANGNRPPSFLIPIYMQAGRRYDIPWPVLAAINAVETDYGRNLSVSSAGAVGWMQFMPSTWTTYGVSADGRHKPNPWDPRDAIFAAARYLKAAGGSQNIARAVLAYNHAGWYVDMVMSRARAIAHQAQYVRAKLSKRGTFSVDFATGLKKHPTVSYSGGVLSHYDRLISAANMVSAANFPYLYGGGHEQPARWGPFDCSGSVSYVMQQAGYKVPTTVSGEIPVWKFPAGPGQVTIFYNAVHTFMRIGNRYFGTSGFARPSGGAGWFNVDKLPAGYLSTFREVHVPRLGPNSFSPNAHYVWPKPHPTFEIPVGLPRTKFRRYQR